MGASAHDSSTGDDNYEALTSTVIARPGGLGRPAASDDRVHYLVVIEGAARGRRIELSDKGMLIGRAKPADIVLNDQEISRNHCRVSLVMGDLCVADAGSSNGTYVGGIRISAPTVVAPGERVSVGAHVLEHEFRSRREVEAAGALDSDLEKAKQYVRSLLPERIRQGTVQTDWVLQPCATLGGDLFGYHFIDPNTFAIYLLDVTGHGTDAAMHAVSVMNVLRQRNLSGVDMRDPARTAAHLNDLFQMETHGGMLLSLWYGVYDLETGTLAYTSAGHHASYLVGPGRIDALPLETSNVLIGMIPGYTYRSSYTKVPRGSQLYVFSDGVFEVEMPDGNEWGIGNFVPLLTAPAQVNMTESRRILEAVKGCTGCETFEDDFTLVVATLG